MPPKLVEMRYRCWVKLASLHNFLLARVLIIEGALIFAFGLLALMAFAILLPPEALNFVHAPRDLVNDRYRFFQAIFQYGGQAVLGLAGLITLRAGLETLRLNQSNRLEARFHKATEFLGSTVGRKGVRPRIEARIAGVQLLASAGENAQSEFGELAVQMLVGYLRSQMRVSTPYARKDLDVALRLVLKLWRQLGRTTPLNLKDLPFKAWKFQEDWSDSDRILPKVDLTGCTFSECDLSGFDVSKAILRSTTFENGSTLRNISWPDAMSGCVFNEVDLSYSVFKGTKIEKCDFSHSILRVEMNNVTCVGFCIFTYANFDHSKLDTVSFGSASLESTQWRGAELKGAMRCGDVSINRTAWDELKGVWHSSDPDSHMPPMPSP